MNRSARLFAVWSLVGGGIFGCQRGAPVPSAANTPSPSTTRTAVKLTVDQKKNDPVAATREAAAREFLQALVSGTIQAAVEKTTVDFRKRLSGPLTFEEERRSGFSNSDTAGFLSECRGNSQGFQLVRHRISPDGKGVTVRGTLGGDGQTRPFSLRIIDEGGTPRIAWFFSAAIPDPGNLPDSDDAESAWAAETFVDFLMLLFGSNADHLLTMSLMTEEFKARLPSPSVADAGLNYAKRDVRNWLNSWRQRYERFRLDSVRATPTQASGRGQLIGAESANFDATLTRESGEWKISNFIIVSPDSEPR